VLLIGAAVLTVMLSWTVMNTVYTLRNADAHFRSKAGGIAFGTRTGKSGPATAICLCRLHNRHHLPGRRG
jgi:hypothetical protein